MGIDRKDELGHPEPAGDDADAAPARTLLDYIDELGSPIIIVLLILIVGFLLLSLAHLRDGCGSGSRGSGAASRSRHSRFPS